MKKNILKCIIVSLSVFMTTICFAGASEDLFSAADTGDLTKARQAISNGADVNARNANKSTSLHAAATWNDALKDNAQSGKFEIAKLLIQKGADVNVRDNNGYTPMHWAAEQQNLKFVQLLTENGADVMPKNKYGSTPLHSVVSTSWFGAFPVAKFLIDKGADVNAKTNNGITPLHNSTIGPNLEAARLLIRKGADVNAKDKNGETPLHKAAQHGRLEVTRLLIRQGADATARTTATVRIKSWQKTFPADSTPLMIARIVGKTKLVEILGKAEKAEILFRKAYKKYKEKKDEKAVILYEEALKQYSSGKIYYHYGNSLSNLPGRLEDSVKAYRMALKSEYHKSHLVHYNIACAYSRMKKEEAAYRYLEAAVKNGYKSFDRLKKDSDLEYLRSRPDWEDFLEKLLNSTCNTTKR